MELLNKARYVNLSEKLKKVLGVLTVEVKTVIFIAYNWVDSLFLSILGGIRTNKISPEI
jgi:hypothetical protein